MGANASTDSGGQQWTPEMIQQYKLMQQQQIRQQQQLQQQQIRQQQQQIRQQQVRQQQNNKTGGLSQEQRKKLQQQQRQNMMMQQQQQAMLNQRQFNLQKPVRQKMSNTKNVTGFQPRIKPIVQNNGEIINSNENYLNPSDFSEKEREREREFERQEKIRRQKFMEEQKKRRDAFSDEMTTFKNSKFNPHKILSLSKDFTLKQLKKSYKIMAMKSHPDRGGDARVFKIVTKSYMFLLDEFNRRNNTNSYSDLQKNSKKWMDTQTTGENVSMNTDDGKFNINRFNQIYSENRINSVDDVGYGDWMKSNELDEDYEPDNLFSDQFNLNMFNSMFNKNQKGSRRKQRQVVEYQEPMALNSANQVACIELGRNKISDFSSSTVSAVPSSKKKLHFTDYKKAHTETTFTDKCGKPKRSDFKSIGDLKMDRKNIKYKMTPRERELYEKKKRFEKEQERNRIARLEQRDRAVFSNYKKINNLILGGNTNTDNGYKQIEYKR